MLKKSELLGVSSSESEWHGFPPSSVSVKRSRIGYVLMSMSCIVPTRLSARRPLTG